MTIDEAWDKANAEVHGKQSGQTSIYNLGSGQYYIDASSGCTWSFTFTPS